MQMCFGVGKGYMLLEKKKTLCLCVCMCVCGGVHGFLCVPGCVG